MADDEPVVTISGTALSLLFYENTRVHDQIGFLMGEILTYVTKTVTDSDRCVENIRQHIDIKNVVAYPISEPFFDTIGYIQKDKLNNFLKNNTKKVVGWYHYRKDFPLQRTLRDTILHAELSDFFSKENKLHTNENFIFCLLNSSISDVGGTHKLKHLLLRKLSHKFKPVPLKINNLIVNVTECDGSDYKSIPKQSSSDNDTFNQIYNCIKDDLKRTSDSHAVILIQKTADHLLQKVISDVTRTDELVSKLELELLELRNIKFRKILESLKEKQLLKGIQQMEVDSKEDTTSQSKNPTSAIHCTSPKDHPADNDTEDNNVKFNAEKQDEKDAPSDSTEDDVQEVVKSPHKGPASPELTRTSMNGKQPVSIFLAKSLANKTNTPSSSPDRDTPDT